MKAWAFSARLSNTRNQITQGFVHLRGIGHGFVGQREQGLQAVGDIFKRHGLQFGTALQRARTP